MIDAEIFRRAYQTSLPVDNQGAHRI
jgi:hypothetical protein